MSFPGIINVFHLAALAGGNLDSVISLKGIKNN